jgi:acyl carrier protein
MPANPKLLTGSRAMQADALSNRVREIVSTIFEVALEDVTAESSPDTIERWDSLGRLVLLVELEQEFSVQLPPEKAERLTSVAGIIAVLEEDGVRAPLAQAL